MWSEGNEGQDKVGQEQFRARDRFCTPGSMISAGVASSHHAPTEPAHFIES